MKKLLPGALALAAFLSACAGGGDEKAPGADGAKAGGAGGKVTLTGAGATFPAPIYSKWFSDYGQAHAVQVNYQSIGSGGGIQQVTAGTVDFGASDAPMTAEESARVPGILQLPTVLGAVTVIYNVPGLAQPLKLSGDVLARIFLGKITRWNDPAIAADNAGVQLPASNIAVVHRSDGSGTTFVFTDYLAQVSPEWKAAVGNGKSVKWPTGLGAKGNEGVAGAVKQTAGSIGYVELAYAMQNRLSMASLKNAAGQYVAPSVDATAAAAAGVAERVAGGDFRVSLVNAPGATTYPISTWTYLLVPPHWQDCGKARAFVGLVSWALAQGDDAARQLDYAPLPDQVRMGVMQKLGTLTCGADNQAVQPAA
ncbi:phosphate ABC transporter substrate-binding protein PstS [Longimicrobium sp.]|uniref:phosphate ABC transporter substrate-binding protein PstS n=1 Tax=Longimicrobium sp. TaxID=2029185 RepID=UPI002D0902DE|nr:phosphate ABC transporter substrate-binding protein PstS [Longimicrobium sp.]HSU13247.1 phosphate ABC transporter substrate-binding protein PstS [Longimicrobium sp.]